MAMDRTYLTRTLLFIQAIQMPPQPNVAYFINKPASTGFNNTRSIHATASDIGSPSVTGNTLVDGDVYYVQGGKLLL